ncbi:hypothetical protein M441DRAFT_52936 [Trichoderma asperellum CBS 433.97]|uniref:Uncharacterized protein n=1 Tax=Trichoderma asperellum (strain ATCC 204424 / CBS 433.97 / NBRC 101777) TaxID=1042311 RepID=A0A2T3ZMZ0_TRIA4|nr:hypothetical protein M441DRAFT_52936 [Trichoderma asperellum CBS 433.97]PTB46168.1 hypothetical protein M441DRAFT_52936 [Trichoderma asperellum CBS 433.97]
MPFMPLTKLSTPQTFPSPHYCSHLTTVEVCTLSPPESIARSSILLPRYFACITPQLAPATSPTHADAPQKVPGEKPAGLLQMPQDGKL